jgi:hypothetical protein
VGGVHVRRKVRKGGNPKKGGILGNWGSVYCEFRGREGKIISVVQTSKSRKGGSQDKCHFGIPVIGFLGVDVSRVKRTRGRALVSINPEGYRTAVI